VDITQHLRVLSRWHRVLIASAVLGLMLAVLFLAKLSFSGGFKMEWRRPEKWQSTSTLFVTQRGFPWGRTTLPGGTGGPQDAKAIDPKGAPKEGDPGTSYADPERLSLLAIIYSFITQSNTIKAIDSKLPPGGTVSAEELANNNAGALPLFKLTTTGQSPETANALNTERSAALTRYLAQQQDENEVPQGQRVRVSVLNKPLATRVSSHGAVLGAALLFLALAAGLATAYTLEALRLGRERTAAEQEREQLGKPNEQGEVVAARWGSPRARG
jgi:hypothetical protein